MDFKFLVAAGLLTIGALLSLHLSYSETQVANLGFSNFKAQFGKKYMTLEEERYRRTIFENKVAEINAHNAQNLSWTMAVNQFSDMTFEEFKNFYLSQVVLDNSASINTPHVQPKAGKKDWRDEKVVTPVKNQASCGSCWAFSATGALEAAWGIKNQGKDLLQFSEQELVDCSGDYGNGGCNGGLMTLAYDYIKDKKINLGEDYKYTARDGACKPKLDKVRTGLESYSLLESFNGDSLIKSLDNQPVAVAIEVQSDFQSYSSGIYKPRNSSCGNGLNHGVLAVGYNTEESYFIVKNSWGTSWGDKGYIKMAIGTGRGTCGIANKWDAIPSL